MASKRMLYDWITKKKSLGLGSGDQTRSHDIKKTFYYHGFGSWSHGKGFLCWLVFFPEDAQMGQKSKIPKTPFEINLKKFLH